MAETSTNTTQLEGLLVGPYLWSGEKLCSFLHDACIVMTKNDEFIHQLNIRSDDVLGTSDIVEMIGDKHWDILKLDEFSTDRYTFRWYTEEPSAAKNRLVVSLLKLIRNKIEHIRSYSNKVKKKLNSADINGRRFQFFYKDKDKIFKLNTNQFMAFWIYTFPKLVPYLWLRFYKLKNQLTKYYPDKEINIEDFQEAYLNMDKYGSELKNALEYDKENGNVLNRFEGCFVGQVDMENGGTSKRLKGPCFTLEFRELHNSLGTKFKIRDTSDFIAVAVGSTDNVVLSVSHSSTHEDKLEYVGPWPGNGEKMIILFTKSITDDQVWKNCNMWDSRVVVFCEPDGLTNKTIEEAVGKVKSIHDFTFAFEESPITGNELSSEKQEWVFEQGEVCIQGREIKIKDIFADCSVVGRLSGDILNQLLKKESRVLFDKYEYPEFEGVYIQRQLSLTNNETCSTQMSIKVVVVASSSPYIQMIKCCNPKKLKCIQEFDSVDHLYEMRDTVKQDCNVTCLCSPVSDIDYEIIAKLKLYFHPRPVHFYQPYDKEVISVICRDVSKMDRKIISEIEFLSEIHFKSSIKSIYFLAESGMGKSKLLADLGRKLKKSLVIFCSFRHFVDLLKERVGTRDCTRTDIKSVVIGILRCSDNCERDFVDFWLERKCCKGARIELQLDGLDEVPRVKSDLAKQAVEVIVHDFDVIRLWVSSTKPIPNEWKVEFTECRIEPFTYSDTREYFTQSWKVKYPKYGIKSDSFCAVIFLTHLGLVPNLNTNLLGSPLMCSMLAELFEDNITELTFFRILISRVDLYPSHLQKRFSFMLKEKLSIQLDENHDVYKLLWEDYMLLHTYLALVHLFPQNCQSFTRPLSMRHLGEESIRKMGIITSTEPLAFTHITYAEFIVARYIMKVLETAELENLCSEETFDNFLCFGKPDERDEEVRISIWKFVELSLEKLTDRKGFKWMDIHNRQKHSYANKFDRFLTDAIEFGLWNLTSLLIMLWVDERDTTACTQILRLVLLSKASLNAPWFISTCEQLSFDNEYELVLCSLENEHYEIAKYLIEQKCGDDVFDRIAEMRECGDGIFHYIVNSIKVKNEFIHKYYFSKGRNVFIRFVLEKSGDEINRKNTRRESVLLAIAFIQSGITSDVKSENISLLIEFLIEGDFEHDLKKQRAKQLQVYTHLALQKLYPEFSNNFPELLALKQLNEEHFCDMSIIESIRSVPLSSEIYSQFFVGLYIVQVLRTSDLDNLCEKATFDKLLYFGTADETCDEALYGWKSVWNGIWSFVEMYLEKITDWNSLNWLKTHKKFEHPLFSQKNLNSFLTHTIKQGFWNLARLLINLWVDEKSTIVCNEILKSAIESKASLVWLKERREQLCFSNQHELIMSSVESGQYEIAKYLIENWCESDVFERIAEKRKGEGGILHCVKLPVVTSHPSNDWITFVETTKGFIRYVYDKSRKEIERKDSHGRNLLLTLPFMETDISTRYLLQKFLIEEMNADVNLISIDGESVLSFRNHSVYKYVPHFQNCELYHQILIVVASANFAHINLKSKVNGLTPLSEAVRFLGSKLRKESLQVLRDLGANFNELDEEGGTILHYCVKYCSDIEFFKLLVEYGSKIAVQNEQHLCALCLAEKEGKVEVVACFREVLKLKKNESCPLNCA